MRTILIPLSFCISMMVIAGDEDSSQPEMFAEISQAAQESAVKFGGMRGTFGVLFGQHTRSLGLANTANATNAASDHKMNIIGLTAGAEYAKGFKSNLLLGLNLSVDFSSRKKKSGLSKDINAEYYEKKYKPLPEGDTDNDYTAELEAPMLIPSLSIKGGYQLKKYESVVFVKLGLSYVQTKVRYYKKGNSDGTVQLSGFSPSIGIGAERKFNKKWGAIIETNFAINRKSKKWFNDQNYQVGFRKFDIRLMGTYTLKSSS